MANPTRPPSTRLSGGWKGMREHEHFVQFYDEDAALLESVAGFLGGGLLAGAGCIVIATREHRVHLGARLRARGFDMDDAVQARQYVALDAETVLASLMVDGSLDPEKFDEIIGPVVASAELRHPRVLAFGEMVALLSQAGNHAAAIELEKLWNRLAMRHAFSLFCAYPRSAFGDDDRHAIEHVCEQHSAVVAA
jgi:hypothetical protein